MNVQIETDVPTTSDEKYHNAKSAPSHQPVSTVTVRQNLRVVVTRKREGTIELRYAPKEPKLEAADTTG